MTEAHVSPQAAPAGPGLSSSLMTAFFPSPPAFYKQFTNSNLSLAKLVVAHPSFQPISEDWKAQQTSILQELEIDEKDIEQVSTVDLRTLLQPPDIKSIEEDGHWMAFGQVWPIKEALPTLEEMGVKQLYADTTTFTDRRKSLHSLLHTLLHTFLQLLSVLLRGPPSLVAEQRGYVQSQARNSLQEPGGEPQGTEADDFISHIRTTAINIHHLCNEWRPVQARQVLKQIMRAQIEERKKRTEELNTICQDIQSKMKVLKTRLDPVSTEDLAKNIIDLDLQPSESHDEHNTQPYATPQPRDAKALARRKMLDALDEMAD